MNGRPWMRAYAALKDSGEEVTLLAEPEPDAPERAHEELLDALTAAADHGEAMRAEAGTMRRALAAIQLHAANTLSTASRDTGDWADDMAKIAGMAIKAQEAPK